MHGIPIEEDPMKKSKFDKKARGSCEPRIVAKYNEYAIAQGVTNGMFYVFYKDTFVGMDAVYADAVSLISLREGQGFDIANVDDLREVV